MGQHAQDIGMESGSKVRFDCTVTESNIHPPTDSMLLWDCVRVLARLLERARELVRFAFSNHTRRAKRRSIGIMNTKGKKARKKLYRDLLKTFTKPKSKIFKWLGVSAKRPTKRLLGLVSVFCR